MRKSKKQFIYVSGPPCGGKTSVCKEIIKNRQQYKYVLGDDYWIKNSQLDFVSRLQATNRHILSSIKDNLSTAILLEWVPSYGTFVDDLKNYCKKENYDFVHILIYAPLEVLEKRKLKRDGNMDLGPIDINQYKKLKDVILFDTDQESLIYVVNQCLTIVK